MTTQHRRPRWRSLCVTGVVGFLLVLTSGCKIGSNLTGADKKYDLLEAELRTREREIQELRGELQQHRLLNQTYQRQPLHPTETVEVGRVPNVPTLPLREILLGSGTGGVDADNSPGDESLSVVVVPKDDDGTVVKVPGQAVVAAYEINRQGIKTQIGQWNVNADQLRRAWKSGLLASGYFVPLQWDRIPSTDRLRITVRFTTNDGQTYEADKDVTVRPLPNRQPTAPIPTPATPSVIPPPNVPTQELPPPAARLKIRL
ncbi:MAG: hypothetical protein ACRC8S_09335 [Fimbriiglobus sp.]